MAFYDDDFDFAVYPDFEPYFLEQGYDFLAFDEFYATPSADTIFYPDFGETLYLGDGLDFVFIDDSYTDYFFNIFPVFDTIIVTDEFVPAHSFALVDDERLVFKDAMIAFDINGDAGQAYRLYDAAFDRAPDVSGLSYWTATLDHGASLHNVAAQFLASPEFQQRYGTTLSDEAFVNLLYHNVLERNPDPAGYAGWLNALHSGESRADVLIGFSESPENYAQTLPEIQNGIILDPHFFV